MFDQKICSIPSCGKKIKARGWCAAHWKQWKKYGDPSGHYRSKLIEFMEKAKSYDGEECLIWPYGKTQFGHGKVWINGKMNTVHRIICEATNGPSGSSKIHCRHICGNGNIGCVSPKHLKWGTASENYEDSVFHGTSCLGERHGNAKLTNEKVLEIRGLIGKMKQFEIAKKYGISRQCVRQIRERETWAWL